jgi:hypothetical protein
MRCRLGQGRAVQMTDRKADLALLLFALIIIAAMLAAL